MKRLCRSVLQSPIFVCMVWLIGSATLLANRPAYRYGDCWWQEYESNRDTALLLHFSPPQLSQNRQLAGGIAHSKQKQQLENDLVDIGGRPQPKIADLDPDRQIPPVDETGAAPNEVFDYSDSRRRLPLPPGMTVTPNGRFGKGLLCDGASALRISLPALKSVECWFRCEACPAQPATLFSVAGGEARLLLRPDGRLELKLKKPQGNPRAHTSPELLQIILAKDAAIVSPDPVPLNEWVHVAIWDKAHPAPGDSSPFDARLTVNGFDVASYISEGGNNYSFLGFGPKNELLIGAALENNSTSAAAGFQGIIDEVRACVAEPNYYERPLLPWRDVSLSRPLQFNRPYFYEDGTIFHASLDNGLTYDLNTAGAGPIVVDLAGQKPDGLLTPGIRGKAWLADPSIALPRLPLAGMSARQGTFEMWLRPVNWDDNTGYWHHSPPPGMNLSVARFYGRDPLKREPVLFMSITLPRAFNLERARVPVDPGHWLHLAAVWSGAEEAPGRMFIGGKPAGGVWRAPASVLAAVTPLYVELGVNDEVTVINREPPCIEVDEIVGYGYPLRDEEIQQAMQRWMGPLEPIKFYRDDLTFKYSLARLEFSLQPRLPHGVTPAACVVSLKDPGGAAIFGPSEQSWNGERFHFVLRDGQPLPTGLYQVNFRVQDTAGKEVIAAVREWDYREDPWRHNRAGILEHTPAPWTPIQIAGRKLETRMTGYVLGDNGLPSEIRAAGENILAGPIELTEDGQPLPGKVEQAPVSRDVDAEWTTTFRGRTCDARLHCRLEYDGMIRHELAVQPKGKVARLALVIPLQAAHARRYLYSRTGATHVTTGVVEPQDGQVLESRTLGAEQAARRSFLTEKKSRPALTWEEYWPPIRDKVEAHEFLVQLGVHDMDRGLLWFCDNAAGWRQSKTVSAAQIQRHGDRVLMILNLVAEPVDYASARPIVFGLLPHPARPLPPKYRLFERVDAKVDSPASSIYDAFLPWAVDPRSHSMQMFPAADPKKPAAGPSWDYAAACISGMKASKPTGLRTMYLSRYWFSCRAGAYDNWEWRSGESQATSLTPNFVNYLCWEMDEWIGRGIFDAVYLDECYETPLRNIEAGLSIKLPDGSEQPGVANFAFRELLKRCAGIFVQHDKQPMLLAHHTGSWQYPGLLFCESTLDGENSPIVSLTTPDWLDGTSLHRSESLQNAGLWGLSTFYMPFIAEGGFNNKTRSQFPVWQWRMARQAQSQFAHFETATTYEGQGAQVYKGYWKDLLAWGAGDAEKCSFHPYWNNQRFVQIGDQTGESLVSIYKQQGKALLIISNRRKTETTLHIKLDLAALGLPPGARVRSVDATFDPPPGEDYKGNADVDQQALAALERQNGAADKRNPPRLSVDELLEDPAKLQARDQAAWSPTLVGNSLSVRVRARDYRVLAVE